MGYYGRYASGTDAMSAFAVRASAAQGSYQPEPAASTYRMRELEIFSDRGSPQLLTTLTARDGENVSLCNAPAVHALRVRPLLAGCDTKAFAVRRLT